MAHVTTFGVKTLAVPASLAGGLVLANAARAMPLVPFGGGSRIETAAGGCGPGFHPNP